MLGAQEKPTVKGAVGEPMCLVWGGEIGINLDFTIVRGGRLAQSLYICLLLEAMRHP